LRVQEAPTQAACLAGRTLAPQLAEWAALLAVVGVAVALRLPGLADPTDLSDEGIRGVQLRLLAAGYRPVAEIYASQGPLSLWLFWPMTALFGPDIVVGRLTAVVSSLVTLAGVVWIARALAGPLSGIAAGLVLAASPGFLENSRLAFVEAPSIAPVPAIRWTGLAVRLVSAAGRGDARQADGGGGCVAGPCAFACSVRRVAA
jgi:predicted membrane-bound mannosyltransferase